MIPKAKAAELVNKFYQASDYIYHEDAKICAIICVDEIIASKDDEHEIKYWEEVKSEIEKL
ncbi:MAG TPA: hypothetical protein VNX68_01195 [Nitrosopumilaceae archaeon]|jgi:hypothetical protein|nr:hypothetical protein [Nitrosopumilaceae archaeon]